MKPCEGKGEGGDGRGDERRRWGRHFGESPLAQRQEYRPRHHSTTG